MKTFLKKLRNNIGLILQWPLKLLHYDIHHEIKKLRKEMETELEQQAYFLSQYIPVMTKFSLQDIPEIKYMHQEHFFNEIQNKSFVRFGDGEYRIMFGAQGIPYQEYSLSLEQALKNVMTSKEHNLLIGHAIMMFRYEKVEFWLTVLRKYFFLFMEMLPRDRVYFNAHYTRSPSLLPHFQEIWEGRDVILVEGDLTRFGVGNDLLHNVKSVKRIICPSANAFRCYDKILNEALKQDKKVLVLIAIGPAGKVLAVDLTQEDFQVWDVGHMDIAYERRKQRKYQKCVVGKYTNESGSGPKFVEFSNFKNTPEYKKYRSQIIAEIK